MTDGETADETARNPETMTDDRRTLGEMSHTNPYTGAVFGETQAYSRGQTVAADGGTPGESSPSSGSASEEADAERADADEESEAETLSDVSHTPPEDEQGAQRAYDRGVRDE